MHEGHAERQRKFKLKVVRGRRWGGGTKRAEEEVWRGGGVARVGGSGAWEPLNL